jgi:hypothetical protein
MTVQFDEASHIYTLNGKRLPSVTQVLSIVENWDGIPPRALEKAKVRGNFIHKAVSLLLEENLDLSSVPAEYAGAIDGMSNFLKLGEISPASYDCIVHHAELGFAGSYDMLAYYENSLDLFEFKASDQVPKTAGPQAEAYKRCIVAAGLPVKNRYCVHLHAKHKLGFKLFPLKDSQGDWNLFLSALNCWRFKYG